MRANRHSMTRHTEAHRTSRIGWLRAAVLGANDGIVSTGSLILGVAAASADQQAILLTGVAGLVAGAMSMAAGEYVSVHAQSDTERADLDRERHELTANLEGEHLELAAIYVTRGLDPVLARQVADQLMAHDALGAHARDELGMSDASAARPVQAAWTSAASFASGAALPLVISAIMPAGALMAGVAITSLVTLAGLGAWAAHAGGASVWRAASRVAVWGAAAMAATALAGRMFGAVL
ncbi:MAG: VIT family protein [Comamonadaceae bacterium]|nr:MAG: VIT family protein [Comamonadaceae bacterium]